MSDTHLLRKILTLASGLSLAACTAYSSDPLLPEEELRALQARGDLAADRIPPRAVPDAAPWFPLAEEVKLRDGLTLAEASSLALFHGPALEAARRRHGVTGAQLLQAGLLPNPELFVGPRLSTEDAGLVLPATLLFAIPLGGRLGAEEERAGAELEVAAWEVAEAELDLLLSVRLTFLRLLRHEREVAVWTGMSEDAGRIAGWAERLAQAGEVDPITSYLARLERDEAIVSLRRAEQAFAEARAELQAMVGLLPEARVEPVLDDSVTTLPLSDPPGSEDLLRHPRLRAAEAGYRRAEADLRLEVERQYPDLGFGPDLEYDRGDFTVGFGLLLPIPLFDTNQGAIRTAVERRHAARESYRTVLLQLRHDAAAARRQREAASALLAATTDTLASAAAAEQAVLGRLQAGQSGLLEILAARRAIALARLRAVELAGQETAAALREAVASGLAAGEEPSIEKEEAR